MGPLADVKIIELAGLGPVPFAGMILADMGADVLRVDRPSEVLEAPPRDPAFAVRLRGRRSVGIDLKHPKGIEVFGKLIEQADILIEGFRPGVAERLGIGPDECLSLNPKLVYGRVTGWGQAGPNAQSAGHDINYIALSGALAAIGRSGQPPVPPLNLVGDFGGGGMLIAFGVVTALFEATRSGRGQVVDAAMLDGAASLMAMFYGELAEGRWTEERGANLLDTGAPFYDVYETADHEFVAIGAIEPRFYSDLLERIGVDESQLPSQYDQEGWPVIREQLRSTFSTRTRDEWTDLLEGTDACFAPVLSMSEAPHHPHNLARGTFIEIADVVQPAPSPRFSRTQLDVPHPAASPGAHAEKVLGDWGFSSDEVLALRSAGAIF